MSSASIRETYYLATPDNLRLLALRVVYEPNAAGISGSRSDFYLGLLDGSVPEHYWVDAYLRKIALLFANGGTIPAGASVEVLSDGRWPSDLKDPLFYYSKDGEEMQWCPETLALKFGERIIEVLQGQSPEFACETWSEMDAPGYLAWYDDLNEATNLDFLISGEENPWTDDAPR